GARGGPPPRDPPGPGGGEEKPEAFSAYVDRGIVPYNCWGFVTNTVSFAPHGGPGGGGCCPCPAHAAHHSTPATLTHLSPGISLSGDGGAPLTVGSQVPKGGVVYVTGNTYSSAPRDALAVFGWTENGKTEAQTNAFTVMSAPIIGDLTLNNYYNDAEDILGSLFPGPEGWVMPPEPGTLRPAHLPKFASLPGDTVLTLEGAEGTVRLWNGNGSAVLLLPGQSVTNYADYQVYVEALSNGTARLTRTFTGSGAASNLTCSSSLPITVREPGVALDIDNENHWGEDYFTTDYKTPGQRALRDQIGKDKSKILFVNDIDKDGSGTPDYMDGWGCTTTQIPLLEREKTSGSNHRAVNAENRFVPVSVSLAAIPSDKVGNVRVRFDYPDSPPETLQRVALTGSGWDNVGPDNRPPAYKITSPTGHIRIWKKDGNVARNAAADYVKSNQTVMTYSELQNLSTPWTFYIEAVNACTNWSGVRVVVSLSLDNGATWVASNAVRVTSMRCNFTVGVVRPFTRRLIPPGRVLYTPDYSTPTAALDKVAKAQIANETAFSVFTKDIWWHEGDALLGHGFAYFQYEGPDLKDILPGDLLSIACTSKTYDHKYYLAKTGDSGFTHWDYDAGKRNRYSELAWWDICTSKVENQFLVIKQTYTLQPERASRLLMAIDDPAREKNFGLHINEANNVWGCLSYVGLAMEKENLDVVNITQCAFNKNMPTTVNKSVWEIIHGARDVQGMSLVAKLAFMQNLVNEILGETAGVPWGGDKAITQQGGGALQGKLFNLLNGKTIARRHPTNHSGYPTSPLTITNIGQVDLEEHQTDHLHYYDPGLFPGVFGEQPKNVFNMDN
ncbi:MAG: hypothetical protein FWH21_07290, partial [Kiritimatiellaeota bacterium]|nr:hypothetical protein [Kiritimatiellota bacterium]